MPSFLSKTRVRPLADATRVAAAGLVATVGLAAAAGLLAIVRLAPASAAPEGAREIAAPVLDPAPAAAGEEVAVLAGGCFWGVQGVFQHLEGVKGAVSGYAGGDATSARYDVVSGGGTGHAEAVRVVYDPARISYARLLQVFFSVAHDPTQLDRQGPDVGPQYRSTVFPLDEEQARVARAYIAQLDGARAFPARIVTTIEPGRAFYPAEAYHQDFMTRHPGHPYIARHDAPKVASLKRLFPAVYRAKPALVGDGAAD